MTNINQVERYFSYCKWLSDGAHAWGVLFDVPGFVVLSSDSGLTWETVQEGAGWMDCWPHPAIHDLIVSTCSCQGVLRSFDYGRTWNTCLNMFFIDLDAVGMGESANVIYGLGHVWRTPIMFGLPAISLDTGRTWQLLHPVDTLTWTDPSVQFWGLVKDAGHADHLFGVGRHGVFETVNDGTSWDTIFSSGTVYSTNSVGYDSEHDVVYAAGILAGGGTLDNDVRRLDRSESVRWQRQDFSPDPSSFTLSCYPNPFNPTTDIRFDLPKAERVQLCIYNSLGQLVTTLLDEPRATGSYASSWDGRNAATGLYFCRLQAGNFVQTRKMLLLK
jgi:hypothetical protein